MLVRVTKYCNTGIITEPSFFKKLKLINEKVIETIKTILYTTL